MPPLADYSGAYSADVRWLMQNVAVIQCVSVGVNYLIAQRHQDENDNNHDQNTEKGAGRLITATAVGACRGESNATLPGQRLGGSHLSFIPARQRTVGEQPFLYFRRPAQQEQSFLYIYQWRYSFGE